jgi:hypothetical protein
LDGFVPLGDLIFIKDPGCRSTPERIGSARWRVVLEGAQFLG